MNEEALLFVIVDMSAITNEPGGQLPGYADAAIRQLYRGHAAALHGYVQRFCTDRATVDDVIQEPSSGPGVTCRS
jgi:hypothetical protein